MRKLMIPFCVCMAACFLLGTLLASPPQEKQETINAGTITAQKIVVKHPDGKPKIEMMAGKNLAGIWITSGKGSEMISIQYDSNTRACAFYLYGPETGLPRLAIANQGDETIIQTATGGKSDSVRFVNVTDLTKKSSK